MAELSLIAGDQGPNQVTMRMFPGYLYMKQNKKKWNIQPKKIPSSAIPCELIEYNIMWQPYNSPFIY